MQDSLASKLAELTAEARKKFPSVEPLDEAREIEQIQALCQKLPDMLMDAARRGQTRFDIMVIQPRHQAGMFTWYMYSPLIGPQVDKAMVELKGAAATMVTWMKAQGLRPGIHHVRHCESHDGMSTMWWDYTLSAHWPRAVPAKKAVAAA
ncbi:hypothetical protein HY971_00815 [Candidatus Kaiserbacteria bacterium]|nr:hypothetical protein [Candidatus Kaiserbacteria bacterium]